MTVYALINDEQQLHIREGEWKPELGPEGFDRVSLHPGTRMAAFVNDCGFGRYPRNMIGALIAVRLGAVLQPLAGPVVFTGWNPAGCGSEVRNLTRSDAAALTEMHADFTAALAGTYTGAAWWVDSVHRDAAALEAADTPTITIVGL